MMENLISILSKIKPNNILEFGFGSGNLSRILRKLYPQSNITGIDKNNKFLTENTIKLFDEVINADILTLQNHKQFDLVIFGNSKIPFWWIYKCYTKKDYKNILNKLISFLSKKGTLVFITKTYNKNSLPSEFLFKKMQDFLLIDCSEPNTSKNIEEEFIKADIINLTWQILKQKGFTDIHIFYIKDSEFCIFQKNPCQNLKINFSPEQFAKAKKLDLEINKYGLEYGYYTILMANVSRETF